MRRLGYGVMPARKLSKQQKENALRVLRRQVKLWQMSFVSRFHVRFAGALKSEAETMTKKDCIKFLERIYLRLGTERALEMKKETWFNKPVQMKFKINESAEEETWTGFIVGRQPYRSGQHWHFVPFSNNEDNLGSPYDLQNEALSGNLNNGKGTGTSMVPAVTHLIRSSKIIV